MSEEDPLPIERNQEAAPAASPETHGLVGSFLQTAAYESLQAPIKGVAQIVDQATATKLAQSVTFMDTPVAAEFNSAAWYGQQFGSAGKLVPFIAAYAVTHKAFGAAGLRAEVTAGAEGASRLLGKNSLLIAETAVAGFGTEAIFKPLQPKFGQTTDLQLSNSEFLTSRLKNGAVGAITFASLTTGTLGLRHLGLAAENPLVSKLLTNNAFGAAVAGIPTGLISAETHARIIEGRTATNQERAEAAYSMFLVGGALGGLMPSTKTGASKGEGAKGELAKSESFRPGENLKETPLENGSSTSPTRAARPAFEVIRESIQQKIGTSYQRFDNFMASINPLLQMSKLEPSYAYASRNSNVGNNLGNRAMQSTLSELGRPNHLENRSLSVKSSAIESGANPLAKGGKQKGDSSFSDEAYDLATASARREAGDKAATKLTDKVKAKPVYEKASAVLEQMGLREVAEFVKGHRVLKDQTVVKSLGHGNDSPAVLELAESAQFPKGGALKVTIAEGGWEPGWGKRPGDAQIYHKVHEVELEGPGFAGSAYLYVQELVVVGKRYSPELVDALAQKHESKGLEITEVGSGIEGQVGVSAKTGELVVIDYPSVTKQGQGNETLDAIRGGKQRVEEGFDAENDAIRRGKSNAEETSSLDREVDLNFEIKRQDAMRGDKFTPKEKDILQQFTQGFSAKEIQMMTALVEGKFDAKGNPDLAAVKPIVDAVLKKARAQGLIEKSKRSDNSFKISDDYRSDPFDHD
ncbi:hypothetical protein KBF38_08800 [bacterium]|nr:hypothetical protein [bacterium]